MQSGPKLLTRATGILSGTFGVLSTLYGILFMQPRPHYLDDDTMTIDS